MSNEIAARFRRWFDYELDAHAKVFSSLATVPPEARERQEYRRALAIFGHIVSARRLWLARLGGGPAPTGSLFPESAALEQLDAEWQTARALWSAYLSRSDDNELSRQFEYQSLDSGRFRNRVEDILAQLFGHSSYHRGQIAMLVRAAGGKPAMTDLVFWCREPVS